MASDDGVPRSDDDARILVGFDGAPRGVGGGLLRGGGGIACGNGCVRQPAVLHVGGRGSRRWGGRSRSTCCLIVSLALGPRCRAPSACAPSTASENDSGYWSPWHGWLDAGALVERGYEGARPRELSSRLPLTTGGLSNILRRLQHDELIEREADTADARSRVVRLTEEERPRPTRRESPRSPRSPRSPSLSSLPAFLCCSRLRNSSTKSLSPLSTPVEY